MRTENVPIADLHHDPANARIHSSRNLEAIKASLARFGQQKPIVVDKSNVVRAGNGTLEAARSLGWEEISVVRSDLHGAEMTAFAIADNRTAELAEWDEDVLAASLQAIDEEDLPVSDTGFSADEVAEMMEALKEPTEIEEDEIPEEPEEPVTQPGDLWILGDHRLLCGDSTSDEDIQALLCGDMTPDLLLTDPPYGIGYGKSGFSGSHGWTDYGKVEWDNERPTKETIQKLVRMAKESIIWGGNYFADYLPPSMGWLVWDKGQRAFSLADCELAWRSEQKAARVLTLSRAKALQDGKRHPTQKPVQLLVWCIERADDPDLIFDPFLGSGTTLIAAEQTGRKCYGMEISPGYCDVIVQRWENMTGEKAVLMEKKL